MITTVDFEDCLDLAKAKIVVLDLGRLTEHYEEMIKYDIAEERLRPHMAHFLELLRERGLYEQQ